MSEYNKYRYEPITPEKVKNLKEGEQVVTHHGKVLTFAGYNPNASNYYKFLFWEPSGYVMHCSDQGYMYESQHKTTQIMIRTEIKEHPNAHIIRAYADGNQVGYKVKWGELADTWMTYGLQTKIFSIIVQPTLGDPSHEWEITG